MKKLLCMLLAFLLCTGTAFAYEDLPFGSKGEEVKQMQTRLKELGFYEKSIDGDFGNLSKTALKAFQAVNGLEQTGEATADVLEVLYSEDAKAAPPKHPLEVVSLQKKGASMRITFKNNTNETITEVGYTFLKYLSNGNMLSDGARRIDNIPDETFSLQFTEHMNLKPNATISKTYVFENVDPRSADVVYAGVYNFTNEQGKTVRYTLDTMRFTGTDGTYLQPLDESEPVHLTEEENKRLDGFTWGINDGFIVYERIASEYSTIPGSHIFEIVPDSLLDYAGLRKGDIITAYDDVPATRQYAAQHAKLRIIDGETVSITYRRNNESLMVDVSLDMEDSGEQNTTAVTAPANESAVSIIDELMRCGDLLERGLITQEEFDLLKQKLLSE